MTSFITLGRVSSETKTLPPPAVGTNDLLDGQVCPVGSSKAGRKCVVAQPAETTCGVITNCV
jgi:hypothetical protein